MVKTEAETRRELINTKLRLSRWDLQNPSQVVEELDIDLIGHGLYKGTITHEKSGHQYADYALFQQGKPVAVIEAKKTSKDAAVLLGRTCNGRTEWKDGEGHTLKTLQEENG